MTIHGYHDVKIHDINQIAFFVFHEIEATSMVKLLLYKWFDARLREAGFTDHDLRRRELLLGLT